MNHSRTNLVWTTAGTIIVVATAIGIIGYYYKNNDNQTDNPNKKSIEEVPSQPIITTSKSSTNNHKAITDDLLDNSNISSNKCNVQKKTKQQKYEERIEKKLKSRNKKKNNNNININQCNSDDNDNMDGNDNHEIDDDNTLQLLPTHLQRDLYKNERRIKMLSKLTMNKPMYDNILLLDPNCNVLATISKKKAYWYISKNLASWYCTTNTTNNTISIKSTNITTTESARDCCTCCSQLKLNFYPRNSSTNTMNITSKNESGNKVTARTDSGDNNQNTKNKNNNTKNNKSNKNIKNNSDAHDNKDNVDVNSVVTENKNNNSSVLFNTSIKINQCVVCGSGGNSNSNGSDSVDDTGTTINNCYMRHYIVPYSIRTKLPYQYKAHLSHDIVLVCPDCSIYVEQLSLHYIHTIECKLRSNYCIQQQLMKSNKQQQQEENQNSNTIDEISNNCNNNTYNLDTIIEQSMKAEIVNTTILHVRSAALALLRWKHQLPIERITEYEQIIQTYYHSSINHHNDSNNDNNLANIHNNDDDDVNDATTTIDNIKNDMIGQKLNQNDDNDRLYYLSNEYLQQLALLQYKIPNPHYISGVDLIVNWLLEKSMTDTISTTSTESLLLLRSTKTDNTSSTGSIHQHDDNSLDKTILNTSTTSTTNTTTAAVDNRIDEFVRDCRWNFITNMQPQYLPTGWSIDAPTKCDSR